MTIVALALFALISTLAGATASVVGFGIGSLITPFVAARHGVDVAVAIVAIPHLVGSAIRGWRLRAHVDVAVLRSFGILSLIGALAGALAYARLGGPSLTRILGALLLLTAIAGLTQWNTRWQPGRRAAWVLGALSGFFGGVVGNQGGLRAAGLHQLRAEPLVFVATSTVIGIMIDVVRTPIYVARVGPEFLEYWPPLAVCTAGVVVGTFLGETVLKAMSREQFRVGVSIAIGLLGAWFLI